MAKKFHGIYCPSITITKENGEIDYNLWRRHLDHLISAGIDGVLIFGSIGEFYAFDLETKKKVMRYVLDHVARRMKVLVGIGGTNPDEVVDFAASAEEAGADGVVAVAPYYFGPSNEAAEDYYDMICKSTKLPALLYNFPPRTGMDLSAKLVARLVSSHPNIVGIKDTVDTISHTRKVIAAVRKVNPDFCVLSGFDEYYTVNRIAGGDGVLCGLTNVEPETFVTMHSAYEREDYQTALRCAERISALMQIYDVADLFISSIKGAVKVKGLPICTDIRKPAVQLTSDQEARIADILECR